ncbi:DNA/RNA non-specific endonuclease [Marinomonas sp. TI.3.20]|uniref:DNA/RNA non-specific endonuclease n=1 Tax=Marinomonas sp. TI.3.20 TaxID=3121296 RepID=UPI00311D83A9
MAGKFKVFVVGALFGGAVLYGYQYVKINDIGEFGNVNSGAIRAVASDLTHKAEGQLTELIPSKSVTHLIRGWFSALSKTGTQQSNTSDHSNANASSSQTTSLRNINDRDGFMEIDLPYYSLMLDCSDRSASLLWTKVHVDTGNVPRERSFHLSDKVPPECRSKSTSTYKGTYNGESYHRGHELRAGLFDFNKQAMHDSFYMVNMTPQNGYLNAHGAWRETEVYTECERDNPAFVSNKLSYYVLAGPIWGNNPLDDIFLASHGVRTPSAYFKVFVVYNNTTGEAHTHSWLMPNAPVSGAERYFVSPKEIADKIGIPKFTQLLKKYNVNMSEKAVSMPLRSNCHRS